MSSALEKINDLAKAVISDEVLINLEEQPGGGFYINFTPNDILSDKEFEEVEPIRINVPGITLGKVNLNGRIIPADSIDEIMTGPIIGVDMAHGKDQSIKRLIIFDEMPDNLSPDHYKGKSGAECWDFIEDFSLDYFLGSAVKYISRAGKKGASKTVEDLRKAIKCIEKKIQILEKEQ